MRDDLYVQSVLAKCEALKRSGVWANTTKIRPMAWLNNFESEEQPVAAVLLDHFVFASTAAVDRMLLSGYRSLRDYLVRRHGKAPAKDILSRAIFTAVEGEDPNLTDSGNFFCRKLRQTVSIDEARFQAPWAALEAARDGLPIIFVDDFVGSGAQFVGTWTRPYAQDYPATFKDAHDRRPFPVFYLTMVASAEGLETIVKVVPLAEVVTTHILGNEYSVRSLPRSRLVPDIPNLPDRIMALLEKYHADLIVPDYMDSPEARKFGHHQLGFLFAFDHSTPDASIPLLWAKGPSNWTPLVRRT